MPKHDLSLRATQDQCATCSGIKPITHARTPSGSCTRALARTQAPARARQGHTRIHTCTHARARTHTHAHTQTHTENAAHHRLPASAVPAWGGRANPRVPRARSQATADRVWVVALRLQQLWLQGMGPGRGSRLQSRGARGTCTPLSEERALTGRFQDPILNVQTPEVQS